MVATKSRIKAISVSKEKGTRKVNVPEAKLHTNFGIIGDAHAGDWHRQVSLLAAESIDKMVTRGAKVSPGNFAENITTEDLDMQSLTIGTKLKLGTEAEIKITQFGKECHNQCEIFRQIGDCIMPREGIFAKVTKAGSIKVGDVIEVAND